MAEQVEVNNGEVLVKFTKPVKGKVSFSELGIKSENLVFEGGFLRIVFDLENIGEHQYFQVPTLEVSYKENIRPLQGNTKKSIKIVY